MSTPSAVGRLVDGAFRPEYPGPGFVGEAPDGGVWISLADRLVRRGAGGETSWAIPDRSPSRPDNTVRQGPGGEV